MLRGTLTKLWKLFPEHALTLMHEEHRPPPSIPLPETPTTTTISLTDRRARVGQVAAFPPGEVEAADELQVERVRGVEHGEAHDVGLVVHNVIQPQEREVLRAPRTTQQGKKGKRKRVFQMSDHVDSLSSVKINTVRGQVQRKKWKCSASNGILSADGEGGKKTRGGRG